MGELSLDRLLNITIAIQPIKSSLDRSCIGPLPRVGHIVIERGRITSKKAARKAAFRSLEGIAYAALSVIMFFRRYAMKPMPAKPRIIIARVGGSATGEGMTTKIQMNVPHPDPQKKSRHRVVVRPTFGQRLAEST